MKTPDLAKDNDTFSDQRGERASKWLQTDNHRHGYRKWAVGGGGGFEIYLTPPCVSLSVAISDVVHTFKAFECVYFRC